MTVMEQEQHFAEYLYIKDIANYHYRLIHMIKLAEEDDSDEDEGIWAHPQSATLNNYKPMNTIKECVGNTLTPKITILFDIWT